MKEPKNWWIVAGIVAALALSFALGNAYSTGGAYSVDVYSDGNAHYNFPLQYPQAVPNIVCDSGIDRIVISLTKTSHFSGPALIRGTTFCGQAVFHAVSLREQTLK